MARTRRREYSNFSRRPRGRKQALVNNLRKGATPPDAWDDIPAAHAGKLYNMINRMIGRFDIETIIEKAVAKTGTPRRVVVEQLEWILRRREWKERHAA
jgi:transposase